MLGLDVTDDFEELYDAQKEIAKNSPDIRYAYVYMYVCVCLYYQVHR